MRAHIETLEMRVAALERRDHALSERWAEASVQAPAQGAQTETTPAVKEVKPVYHQPVHKAQPQAQQPSSVPQFQEMYEGKFQQVVRLELNTIDSTTLVRVPGIGAGTAHAILHYRRQLGGFYSTDQLRERITWDGALPYIDKWCNEWFYVDEYFMQKMKLNTLSFKELVHHPYLNFEDVKAICRWRDRYGAVRGITDLEQLLAADSTKIEKLLHYVEF